MRPLNLHPWQSTALALLGCAVGLLLHLRWHPLRQHLSDAWDFVRLRPLLVAGAAGAMLLAEAAGGERPPAWTLLQLGDWREIVGAMAGQAAERLAVLPHALIAPWPLACLMPLVLGLLAVRVWRRPYRYGKRRAGPEQKFSLLAATAAGAGWLVLEALGLRDMLSEALEMIKLGLRYVFSALAAAGLQVWLVRLVFAWERPEKTTAEDDAGVALEHTFARWQGVACLGAFNVGWMAWRQWALASPDLPALNGWLWVEFLLLFAGLPVAVAAISAPFWEQGAAALRILLRSAVPLLLLAVTALAFLILAHYTAAVARALCMDAPLLRLFIMPLNALGLAMIDSWLMLTALLLMLRLGFSRSPTA